MAHRMDDVIAAAYPAEAVNQQENLVDSIQRGVKAEYIASRLDSLAAEIADAQAELSVTVVQRVVTDATELRDVVLALGGGIDELLAHGTPQERAEFYAGLGVELLVDPEQHRVSVTLTPTADRAAAVHETVEWLGG
ncbi:hypothetical protein ACX3O0_04535 [Homoserinimonas sp. A447]